MDPCSLSNFSGIKVNHYHWILKPDFSTKSIAATIEIKAIVLSDNVEKLVSVEIVFKLKISAIFV